MGKTMLVAALTLALMVAGIAYAATPYDLTALGAAATINGAIFEVFSPDDPAGSGSYNGFLRLSPEPAIIEGYNSDHRPVQFDEDTSLTLTHAILLSEVPQFDVAGT